MLVKSLVAAAVTFPPLVSARVKYLGVSIAGGDFGCTIDGKCLTSSTQLPLLNLGGGDGAGQMSFFSSSNLFNIFRLPIAWQYLVPAPGAPLNLTAFSHYNQLITTCLSTGAHCLLSLHNFARWDGAIIGQSGPSGPSNEDFASLWTQLLTALLREPLPASSFSRLAFELMNEPHNLSLPAWTTTLSGAVTAIRATSKTTDNLILLPGTGFASAGEFLSSGSGDALSGIRNPDGTTTNLIFALHKYLDADNSGTTSQCSTNNTAAFGEVAAFLRKQRRQAMISETGAAPGNPECFVRFCEQNAFINANPDVFLGLLSWGAGSFKTDYLLSQTPFREGGRFINQPLMQQCIVGTWMASTAGVKDLQEISTTPTDPLATADAKDWSSTTTTPIGLLLLALCLTTSLIL